MKSLKKLIEDAFQDKVNYTYSTELADKTDLKPSYFDKDALELGVIYELGIVKNFKKALLKAMQNLKKDPHCYDDVDDYGTKNNPQFRTNQITWTGHPATSVFKI